MIRVMFIEASSGGVVGGSLTGLYHLIRGLDRERFAPAMVLYEPKAIEAELRAFDVPVLSRAPPAYSEGACAAAVRRLSACQASRRSHWIAAAIRARQALRLAVEERPAAVRLAPIIRRAHADVVHLGNGVRANFDGILACLLTRTPCVCHVKGFEKYGERERRVAARVDALVCMTQAVEAHCRQHGVRGRRTQVVYDALDEGGVRDRQPAAASRPCRARHYQRRSVPRRYREYSGMEGAGGVRRSHGAGYRSGAERARASSSAVCIVLARRTTSSYKSAFGRCTCRTAAVDHRLPQPTSPM